MNKSIITKSLALIMPSFSTAVCLADDNIDDQKVESVRTSALKEHAFSKGLADGRQQKFLELKNTVMQLKEYKSNKAFEVSHLYSQVSSNYAENPMLLTTNYFIW